MKGRVDSSVRIPAADAFPDLVGTALPSLELRSGDGTFVNPAFLPERSVFVLNPVALPQGVPVKGTLEMDFSIGTSVATLLAFNRMHGELASMGIRVFGINVQSPHMQALVADALGLTYPLLSDRDAQLGRALGIPLIHKGRSCRFPTLVLESRMGVIRRQIVPSPHSDTVYEELRHSLLH